MTTICLYSELDAFSGYIRHDIQDIDRLIKDLKLACLFYDQVIVNTPVIIEHPLTLPAFEVLAPFVHAGILWTSGSNSKKTPYNFLEDRINVFYDKKRNKKLNSSIEETLQRWEAIIPPNWNLLRNVDNQVHNATTNIINNLSELQTPKTEETYKYRVLESLYQMQSDNLFNRDYLLAKIGNFRGELSVKSISDISVIVQSEYLNQGSSNKGNLKIVLFPGAFVQKTNQSTFLKNYLPIDLATIPTALQRFARIGYPIKNLLKWPVYDLYSLATSEIWITWRKYLLSENWNEETAKEMTALYLNRVSLSKALALSYENINPSQIKVASDWQLIGKSLLGTLSSQPSVLNNEYILDLNERRLYLKNTSISMRLEDSHFTVLSVLVSSGNFGLDIEQIKRLDREKQLIIRKSTKQDFNYKANHLFDESILNRLYVLKNRINKKIAKLGISIITDNKSRWLLKLPENYSISLDGSVWDYHHNKNIKLEILPQLSPQNEKLYLLLKEHSPAFISTKKIATELFKNSCNPQKTVSDAIYKLQKKLNGSPYTVIRDYVGRYALIQN